MLESIKEFWYMWLVLLLLIGVLIWALTRAQRAVKRRYSRLNAQEDEMKKYKLLLEKYEGISKENAENADPAELCHGMAAVLQRRIETAEDMNSEFLLSPVWLQTVYALDYFAEDSREALSAFYKKNGEPLLKLATEGLSVIGDPVASMAEKMYSMYDENNESVSLDKELVTELDREFAESFNEEAFFGGVKTYIISNL